MSGHVSPPAEVLPTEQAAVRLLSGVTPHVCRERPAVFEGFIAARAGKRSLARVISYVSIQISLKAKSFTTI